MRHSLWILCLVMAACAPAASPAPPANVRATIPFTRCINLGNALEAPAEGDWGYRIADADFDRIAAAGFNGVRVPVRWDPHMGPAPDFTVDPAFLARVDHVIDAALQRRLAVVLDVHHFDALYADPQRQLGAFAALWRQIAVRYVDRPPGLIYEALNEAHGDLMPARVVSAINETALREIRRADAIRLVIVGPPNWNSIEGLDGWSPPDDPFVAVGVHYYDPHDFTHAGAEWLKPAPTFDRRWGNAGDLETVRRKAARAAAFGRTHNVAMLLGEFGVNAAVPLEQRALWSRHVRRTFEAQGMSWCAWDYAGGFPAWDRQRDRWIDPMKRALLD